MSNQHFKNKPLLERRELVKAIIDRMLKAYHLTEVKALAPIFGCTYGAIKNWGSAGRVPLEAITQCHFDSGVSLDWLINGSGTAVIFDPKKVNQLTKHLANELATGVRYQLIEQKRRDGIDVLAAGLSKSLLEWMEADVIGDNEIPLIIKDSMK